MVSRGVSRGVRWGTKPLSAPLLLASILIVAALYILALPVPGHASVVVRNVGGVHVPAKRVFATSFCSRLRGLIGRDDRWLPPGSELVFLRCRSVHTFFMRRLLDVAFIGPDGTVLRAERDVFPRTVLLCRAIH